MLKNGSIEVIDNEINYGEVSDYYPEVCLAVNYVFGTKFRPNV
jgi:hypothetical protein